MGSARDANRSEGKRKIVAGPLCKSVKAGKNCPRWARPGPFSLVLLYLKTADDARPHLVLRPLSCPAVISVCYAGPAGRHICGGAAGATWIWSGVGRGDTTPARLKPYSLHYRYRSDCAFHHAAAACRCFVGVLGERGQASVALVTRRTRCTWPVYPMCSEKRDKGQENLKQP